MPVTVAVLIAFLIFAGVAAAIVCWRSRDKDLPTVNMPDDPSFIIQPPASGMTADSGPSADLGTPEPAGPGFTVVSVTSGPPPGRGPTTRRPNAVTGFSFVGVTENLTAICKLTGSQVRVCTCAKHRGRSRS